VVEVVTDNKNRSASSVRSNFARNDGNLGADGAVSWMFHKKGQIVINKGTLDTDDFMMQALEAGAEDIAEENGKFIITTEFSEFMGVKENLEKEGFLIESAELTMIPENNVEITDEEMATKVLKLYEALEENEDVQNIYANFEISDEIMEKIDN
jgi:YebC/PmpR family DNA-binding regulatory protein